MDHRHLDIQPNQWGVAAIHAKQRVSMDADHVLHDLEERFQHLLDF